MDDHPVLCEIMGSFPSMNSPCTCRRRMQNAFTMIELLVVLVIIALLAGLVVPGVQKALDRTRAAQCVSNLHQVGVAFQIYLVGSNNVLPQRVYNDVTYKGYELGYDEMIFPDDGTRKKVIVCPMHRKPGYPSEPSYGMNWYYDNSNVMIVDRPSRTILATETLGTSDRGSHRADRDSGDPGQLDSKRHGGKANYLFFDGHVESLFFAETTVPLDASAVPPVDMWGVDQGRHDEPVPSTWSPP